MTKPASKTVEKRRGPWNCLLDKQCLEDLNWWVSTDPRNAKKILALMDAVLRDPFTGTGKPEHLKRLSQPLWSRRITQEHRLTYVVVDDRVTFLQARYHYGK